MNTATIHYLIQDELKELFKAAANTKSSSRFEGEIGSRAAQPGAARASGDP